MAERDDLGRTLALAREALRGPAAMKQRVGAQLAMGSLAARVPAASPPNTSLLAAGRRLLARRYHLATVSLLVGVGFGAGFWLGRVPPERLREDGVEAVTLAVASPAHAASARSATGGAPGTLAREAALPPHGLTSAGTAGASEPTSASSPQPPRTADDGTPATSDSPANAPSRTATSTNSTTSTQPATPRRLEPRAVRAASDDALMREVTLLERIDRALRAGEGGLAAALLDELDRSVPAPALRDERAVARVLARCVVARDGSFGVRQQAQTSAERFLARDPTSVYADRIRAACPPDGDGTNRRAGIEEPVPAGH